MPELHYPWLESAIVLPAAGAIVVSFIRRAENAHRFCCFVCALVFLLTVGEWIDLTIIRRFEAHDHWDFIQLIFQKNVFVVDELSAPLLPLAALQYLMTIVSTLRTKLERVSFWSIMLSEAILLAAFSTRLPWLLIALLSLSVILPWLELRSRGYSPNVFAIHMGLFVILLVAGQVFIDASPGASFGAVIGGALLTAAGLLRTGIVPLHCWITDLFEKATFGTALLFVTPMSGAYLVMRLVFPVAPDWALRSIAIISLVTAVYASGMSLVQSDARRFYCYLFLSHSSLVLVGMELATPIGLTGGLCVWLSVGLSLAGFGLTLRSLESRIGRISLSEYHGLQNHTPVLASLYLVTGLASIGFPGTVGFIGTELLIEGAFAVFPAGGIAVVLAAALNGVAILSSYCRVFAGSRPPASISLRAKVRERFAVLVLVALIFGGGLYPQPGVASRYHAANELIRLRQHSSGDEKSTNITQHDH